LTTALKRPIIYKLCREGDKIMARPELSLWIKRPSSMLAEQTIRTNSRTVGALAGGSAAIAAILEWPLKVVKRTAVGSTIALGQALTSASREIL
jgi:hypothetical protein